MEKERREGKTKRNKNIILVKYFIIILNDTVGNLYSCSVYIGKVRVTWYYYLDITWFTILENYLLRLHFKSQSLGWKNNILSSFLVNNNLAMSFYGRNWPLTSFLFCFWKRLCCIHNVYIPCHNLGFVFFSSSKWP